MEKMIQQRFVVMVNYPCGHCGHDDCAGCGGLNTLGADAGPELANLVRRENGWQEIIYFEGVPSGEIATYLVGNEPSRNLYFRVFPTTALEEQEAFMDVYCIP